MRGVGRGASCESRTCRLLAILVNATGESRQAVLSLVVFFIIGGLLLSRLDVEKGRRQADEANRVDQDARAVRSSAEAPVGEDHQ